MVIRRAGRGLRDLGFGYVRSAHRHWVFFCSWAEFPRASTSNHRVTTTSKLPGLATTVGLRTKPRADSQDTIGWAVRLQSPVSKYQSRVLRRDYAQRTNYRRGWATSSDRRPSVCQSFILGEESKTHLQVKHIKNERKWLCPLPGLDRSRKQKQ